LTDSRAPAREIWRTAIASADGDTINVRGFDLRDLMRDLDFVSAAFLVYQGRLPTPQQRDMLNAMLVSAIDHGISPSATVARFIAGAGSPIQASVAGALLTYGDIHAGAGEEMCQLLERGVAAMAPDEGPERVAEEIIAEYRTSKRPLPGYGHPQHPAGDPRVPVLIDKARQLSVDGPHLALALAMEDALARRVGRRIPMNIDGVLSGLQCDMGFGWRYSRPLAMMSRIVGLSAHAIEESVRERGWRQLAPEDIVYDGPALSRETLSGETLSGETLPGPA
jgi:citrate synthase